MREKERKQQVLQDFSVTRKMFIPIY